MSVLITTYLPTLMSERMYFPMVVTVPREPTEESGEKLKGARASSVLRRGNNAS